MLPIALTCPLWWVARWTARTLATLAVLVACSFGTATLPLGGAATAPTAPTVVASAEGPALRAATGPHLQAGADGTAADSVRGPASRGGAVHAAAPGLRGDAVDGPARPAGEPGPLAALAPVTRTADRPVAVPRPADRPLVPAGLVPATVGSRAPPAR
ncbi:hypothetical protein GCE86_03870 [Micromonospora terminaliae]|uniref:Uncharacterized protein n=1 Tax=Micromonospora terminaliae TaxID=1914461 RepID=A0AAJ3DLM5_9ACTN|nr:hypothetical protein [Micromonospora terminaliae]NES31052.1 hypothetical protein [Micromonospora terminaliae]QGL46261.1 hypothetical protein GCE86_03870 [Micromonospora terminaliae]